MEKINIAVIGTGHLGKIHCNLLATNELANFVGVYDSVADIAKSVADEHSVQCFETLQDAINACDAVLIVVPTIYHYETAKQCIEAVKHCFIEKPLVQFYSEALQLQALHAKHSELKIQVGHIERFNPALQPVLQHIGNPMFIEAHRLSQFRPRATDVSVIHDLMIHDIDLVQWLVKSDISHIEANGVSVITDTIDIANARLTFANGAVANITASRISAKPMRKLRLFQRYGYISVDLANAKLEVFRLANDGEQHPNAIPASMLGAIDGLDSSVSIIYEQPEIPQVNAMAEEQMSFIRSIIDRTDTAVNIAEGSVAVKVAEEITNMIGSDMRVENTRK
ncbi:MAG: Gfo/Idh/MocA family oxidoreductase [Ignavibacteria bacterium]|jgi:predicted dehydrogenase|nr:Gfo/Idh/MocA family oxidoreductase [Ignavibacteria bacterium]